MWSHAEHGSTPSGTRGGRRCARRVDVDVLAGARGGVEEACLEEMMVAHMSAQK